MTNLSTGGMEKNPISLVRVFSCFCFLCKLRVKTDDNFPCAHTKETFKIKYALVPFYTI